MTNKNIKIVSGHYKITRKCIAYIVVYISIRDEPFSALEAKIATSKMSGIPIDDISLDWYFYQYDDDIFYQKKYKRIILYKSIPWIKWKSLIRGHYSESSRKRIQIIVAEDYGKSNYLGTNIERFFNKFSLHMPDSVLCSHDWVLSLHQYGVGFFYFFAKDYWLC